MLQCKDFVWLLSGLMFVAAGASAQTSTLWNDGGVGPEWNDPNNWGNGVPQSSWDAFHTTSVSDIEVNTTSATCLSFTGTPAVKDRFLVVLAGKTWTIGAGGLSRSGSADQFIVNLEDGVTGGTPARTTVDVGGNVDGIYFSAAKSNTAEFVKIDIDGDVDETSIILGDDGEVNVTGDVTGSGANVWTIPESGELDIDGDLNGIQLNVGGASDTASTVATIGTSGAYSTMTGTWTLRGETDLTVEGEFTAGSSGAAVILNEDAKMTVEGDTTGALWILNGISRAPYFVATTANTAVTGGVWRLMTSGARVDAEEIQGGEWEVSGILNVDTTLNPDTLEIDGGTVTAYVLSDDSTVWDMSMLGDAHLTVDLDAWHSGIADGLGSNSTLVYSGQDNEYVSDGNIFINGDLVRTSPTSEMFVKSTYGTWFNAETVRIDGSNNTIILDDYDVEGLTVTIPADSCVDDRVLEVFAPDYDDGVHAYEDVVFIDSPCVRLLEEVIVEASGTTGHCGHLFDGYKSTPISGGSKAAGANLLDEALYVEELTVESGAVFVTGGLNVYYTGSVTGSPTDIRVSSGGATYTPVQVNMTVYGNFDGDMQLNDSDDVTRFNDAFPSDMEDNEYDPLVDWNCDGRINCDDRAQFLANFPNATGVEDDSCS